MLWWGRPVPDASMERLVKLSSNVTMTLSRFRWRSPLRYASYASDRKSSVLAPAGVEYTADPEFLREGSGTCVIS